MTRPAASRPALSEFDLISRYFVRAPRHTVLGIGDDAALLAVTAGSEIAASTDMLVEGVHFFADADPQAIGHKALAVNLSDLAAMAATPRWAMLALAIPEADPNWLEAFSRGFFALADKHGVDLVGGDTTRGPRNICVQIMGEVASGKALRRDTAKIGDDIWVSGELGAAAAAVAHRRGELQLPPAVLEQCRMRLDWPTPRVALGLELAAMANSAIDISDGLLGDLAHICERSGVGAEIDSAAVPCAAVLQPLRHQTPVSRAVLAGGDDYELCFTAEPLRAAEIAGLSAILEIRLTRVGRIVEGDTVSVLDASGRPQFVEDHGFDHFG
ncbi:MAG: thiamine-phosphate kinase [Burkholderiales bacterium]|jgi:thiamine-monophosphate kinase